MSTRTSGPGDDRAERRRRGAFAWMASNPVAANLLMATLVVGGIAMVSTMVREEVFPQVAPDLIQITVPYPSASPEEVEEGVLLVLEEAVRGLDDVKEITAKAQEGSAVVSVELESGADMNKALADVKGAVDRIVSFPRDIERPVVMAPRWKAEAIWVVLYGEPDLLVLQAMAEQIRDDLVRLPGITQAELATKWPKEIAVEISQERLRAYGLTLEAVAAGISQTARDVPAGGVKTRGGEVLLRTRERRDLGEEFADIPVLRGSDGVPVRLGELADIRDGFAEVDAFLAFEGKPSMLIKVYSVGDESPTDVASEAKRFVEELRPSLPDGVEISTWGDMAELYDQRLDLLLRNASFGLVLVLVILGLFLEPRLAFWVTMGIPISFLGSFLLLPVMDVSLNMVSLFAFIVTLGMVVDDAIVVGENTFRLRQEGKSALEAAVMGARQVATPVFFSIATTIAAFSPLLFIPGTRGKFMRAIPVVVILVLALSLVESFFVLPAHLAHVGRARLLSGLVRVQGRVARAIERWIQRRYRPFVAAVLRHRWLALATGVATLIGASGLMAGGHVAFVDWPREESDWVRVEARLPFGVDISETRALVDRLVGAAHEVIEENGGQAINRGILAQAGNGYQTHVANVWAYLVSSERRDIASSDFADQWRERLGDIPGLESLTFDASTGGRSKPIDLKLSHRDPAVLEAAARALADELQTFDGVQDIDDGIELGKPQLDFTLSEEGKAAGLQALDVARQLRAAFYGVEAIRQQRGRSEIRVMVRLPRAERESLATVEGLMIRAPSGGEIPLSQAADVQVGRAYTSLERTDGRRTLRVQAAVDHKKANAQEVMASLKAEALPRLMARHPGLSHSMAGRQRSMNEFMTYLKVAYMMALLVMYALIAVPLRSYLQPLLVVMAAIPFGFVGAVLGHLFMGVDMSLVSMMGFVALSGVVVNDSIVLVDAANHFRRKGRSPYEAALEASVMRFRPIVLTSLTTFAGLMPMILEQSVQARVLIPMAISLGFGVLFATIVILLLVPSFFVMVENLRAMIGRLRREPIM